MNGLSLPGFWGGAAAGRLLLLVRLFALERRRLANRLREKIRIAVNRPRGGCGGGEAGGRIKYWRLNAKTSGNSAEHTWKSWRTGQNSRAWCDNKPTGHRSIDCVTSLRGLCVWHHKQDCVTSHTGQPIVWHGQFKDVLPLISTSSVPPASARYLYSAKMFFFCLTEHILWKTEICVSEVGEQQSLRLRLSRYKSRRSSDRTDRCFCKTFRDAETVLKNTVEPRKSLRTSRYSDKEVEVAVSQNTFAVSKVKP